MYKLKYIIIMYVCNLAVSKSYKVTRDTRI